MVDDNLLAKTQVNYRKGDNTMSCGDCLHFLAPSKCELVQGTISISALCDLFEAAKGDEEKSEGGMASLMEDLFGKGQVNDEVEKEQDA